MRELVTHELFKRRGTEISKCFKQMTDLGLFLSLMYSTVLMCCPNVGKLT